MASIRLCAAAAHLVDGIDLGLFPSILKSLETEFTLTPTQLGLLTMMGSVANCLTMVLWGCLADNFNRKILFVASMAMLGVLTAATTLAYSFWTLAATRIVVGCFASSLLPLTQSLLADASAGGDFGVAFGLLAMASQLSGAIAALLAGWVGNWRSAYFSMGIATLFLSLCMSVLMPDPDSSEGAAVTKAGLPRARAGFRRGAGSGSWGDWFAGEMAKVRGIFRRRTFLALLAGGVVGNIPWQALQFLMLFLASMGFTGSQVGIIMTFCGVGKALGSYTGGMLGDELARRSPLHGRALVAQATIASGAFALLVPLRMLPWSPEYFQSYCVSLFVFGFVSTWCAPAVDRPLWAELVAPESRGTVVAWWTFFAGTLGSACGTPIVGAIAEHHLHYRLGPLNDRENVAALSQALVMCTFVPWVLCFCAYSMIHYTYEKDCADVRILSQSSRLKAAAYRAVS